MLCNASVEQGVDERATWEDDLLQPFLCKNCCAKVLPHLLPPASLPGYRCGVIVTRRLALPDTMYNGHAIAARGSISQQLWVALFAQRTEVKFDLVSPVDELARQIRLEFDFLHEARTMDAISQNLKVYASHRKLLSA